MHHSLTKRLAIHPLEASFSSNTSMHSTLSDKHQVDLWRLIKSQFVSCKHTLSRSPATLYCYVVGIGLVSAPLESGERVYQVLI